MSLLSVLLRSDCVEFDGVGIRERYTITGTPSVFGISHRHGNLIAEVRDGRLILGWPSSDKLIPNMPMTTTYRRLDSFRFYPEVMISIAGPIEIVQLSK